MKSVLGAAMLVTATIQVAHAGDGENSPTENAGAGNFTA